VAAGQIPDVSDRFFLVDPLDGTKEFISRNGEFTVNIALVEHGRPVLGLVYARRSVGCSPAPRCGAWLEEDGPGQARDPAPGRAGTRG
jgi:3'(2'), 5'-bisphosphate nucleotidase